MTTNEKSNALISFAIGAILISPIILALVENPVPNLIWLAFNTGLLISALIVRRR